MLYTCHYCDRTHLDGLFSLACHLWQHHYRQWEDQNKAARDKIRYYTDRATAALERAEDSIMEYTDSVPMLTCEHCKAVLPDTDIHLVAHTMRYHVEKLDTDREMRRDFLEAWTTALPDFNRCYVR